MNAMTLDTRVVGRYGIEGRIAAGGMGEVYRAVDRCSGRVVAIKRAVCEDPTTAEEHACVLEGEYAALCRVRSPYVVAALDEGLRESPAWFAMEYVDGLPLSASLERGPLPLAAIAGVFLPLFRALGAVHDAELLHRDVKPANLLLAKDGRVVLVDFGLARPIYPVPEVFGVQGTPRYLSPERILGHRAEDPRSDLFGAGCMLYEALTGRPAFTGDDWDEVLDSVVSDDPTPPSLRRPEVPLALDVIALRLLEKDPSRRPASAREAADLLARALGTSATRPVRRAG